MKTPPKRLSICCSKLLNLNLLGSPDVFVALPIFHDLEPWVPCLCRHFLMGGNSHQVRQGSGNPKSHGEILVPFSPLGRGRICSNPTFACNKFSQQPSDPKNITRSTNFDHVASSTYHFSCLDATHTIQMERKTSPEQMCTFVQPRSSHNSLHILKLSPAIDGSLQAFLPASPLRSQHFF